MSSDPSICLLHRRKRPQVGVCHLCLKDRLLRLSLSDSSAPSFLSSSRSSFDSSDNTSSNANALGAATDNSNSKSAGKLGTIFSLMESDNEEMAARIEEEEQSDRVDAAEAAPSYMLRSKSVSQWSTLPPRRSSCVRVTDTDPGSNAVDGYAAKPNGTRSTHSPLISASATPVVNHVDRDHHPKSTTKNHPGGLSWISSLFKLGKRKKKSTHNGPVETNFFPPEAWNDEFQQQVADRDRLWRSRSVSSGRVIKRSFTPLVVGEDPVVSVTGIDPAPPRSSSSSGVEPPSRVSSLIALDMREAATKVQMAGDVAGDKSYVAVPGRASVASLMDIDRKYVESTCAASPGSLLQRSRSTGGWRRKIRSESPSSVLVPPAANPTTTPGGEWSFYLTPLRTFSRNRSSRHAR